MMFKIAFRNIFRNARRSIMTMLAIAIGAAAMLVFGAYSQYDLYVLQTATVARTGHLQVYRKGFFEFGSGNPAIWGMDDYRGVLHLIVNDPVLAPMIAVATPVQFLTGIAGNPQNDESKTFFATGFIPSDLARMQRWNEYGARDDSVSTEGLADNDPTLGVIGIGFARILGLCAPLHVSGCPNLPSALPEHESAAADLSALPHQDFSALAGPAAAPAAGPPAINLLSSTAGGAPNIVTLRIRHVEYQAAREMDDNYIAMHLALAQQLVYGRGEHKVSAIILQLHRTEDIPTARTRLSALFRQHHLGLDAHDFFEINSFYGQAEGFFASVFSFIAVIMGIVVLFTVSNAMSMSVVERTDEIGTTRALGVRRSRIRTQFLLEGSMLGLLGATLGVGLAFAATMAVNNSGLAWTPPGDAHPIALKLYLTGAVQLIVAVWLVLIGVATVAAFLPANRAARLAIVDALRHV
jgi:putative ABC transport system permease protein